MNPFDWSGPEFLALYVPLAIACVVCTFLWSRALHAPRQAERVGDLHPYEVAHLVGGAARAVDAALAHLVESGVLSFDKLTQLFARDHDLPRDAHPLEKALVAAVTEPTPIATLRAAAANEVGRIRQRLETLGLELNDRQLNAARWVPGLLILGVLGFGLVKLAIGVSIHKPVGFLVLGSVLLF
jgi:uncharacterized protein (TIGR04222 family)